MAQVKGEISSIEQELKDYRKEIRLALRQPSLEYTNVLQTEVNQEKGGWAALHVCLLQCYGLYFIKGKQKLFISLKVKQKLFIFLKGNGSCLFPYRETEAVYFIKRKWELFISLKENRSCLFP